MIWSNCNISGPTFAGRPRGGRPRRQNGGLPLPISEATKHPPVSGSRCQRKSARGLDATTMSMLQNIETMTKAINTAGWYALRQSSRKDYGHSRHFHRCVIHSFGTQLVFAKQQAAAPEVPYVSPGIYYNTFAAHHSQIQPLQIYNAPCLHHPTDHFGPALHQGHPGSWMSHPHQRQAKVPRRRPPQALRRPRRPPKPPRRPIRHARLHLYMHASPFLSLWSS
jgi:hypothetical protein